MPSHSPEQKKTMAAIAHGWRPTGPAASIPVSVAKEYFAADQAGAPQHGAPVSARDRVARSLAGIK
jgi:hypothetical protein